MYDNNYQNLVEEAIPRDYNLQFTMEERFTLTPNENGVISNENLFLDVVLT